MCGSLLFAVYYIMYLKVIIITPVHAQGVKQSVCMSVVIIVVVVVVSTKIAYLGDLGT